MDRKRCMNIPPGETGVAGLTVILLDGAGTELARTTTDAQGLFSFKDLAPGAYAIKVDPAALPKGYVFTTKNARKTTSANDSDMAANGQTQTFDLTAVQAYSEADGCTLEP